MSTYVQQYALAQNAAFRQQIATALVLTADNVILVEDGGTTNHAARVVLAQAVLMDADLWASRMALAVVEKSTGISDDAPSGPAADADIFSSVDAIWNYYANALVAQG